MAEPDPEPTLNLTLNLAVVSTTTMDPLNLTLNLIRVPKHGSTRSPTLANPDAGADVGAEGDSGLLPYTVLTYMLSGNVAMSTNLPHAFCVRVCLFLNY